MPYLTLDEINENPACNPPASWVTDPLPYLNDINKVGKWTDDDFCDTIALPLKSYMWFKFKCLKNKTGRCFKTFYRDMTGDLYYSWKELKEKCWGPLPNYEWSIQKKSIHYNLDLDTLYIGGSKMNRQAVQLVIQD